MVRMLLVSSQLMLQKFSRHATKTDVKVHFQRLSRWDSSRPLTPDPDLAPQMFLNRCQLLLPASVNVAV